MQEKLWFSLIFHIANKFNFVYINAIIYWKNHFEKFIYEGFFIKIRFMYDWNML